MFAAGQSRAAPRSRRTWGWYRLTDEWAWRLVDAAGIRPGELVLDIGAGDGALTRHLVRAQARVIAVELHPGRAGTLRQRFPEVTVVRADAAALRLPRQPFRVVANPPFGITAQLLRVLLAPGSRLLAADLVLQRAVVRRCVSGPGRGAGRWQRTFAASNGMTLPRSAFMPPPRVDSSVLVLRRRPAAAGHGRAAR